MTILRIAVLSASACVLAACASQEPGASVPGKMRFVLGATSSSPAAFVAGAGAQPASLTAGVEYIVSPRKAKITFTSVVFRNGDETLGTSEFTNCTVTYDRALPSGSTLLDCAFTIPVGEITQMALYFDKTLELQVSDATAGIYSDAASSTKYTTTAPAGGANFVTFTINIGDNSTSRATPIIFAAPLSIDEGTTPTLYATMDMIQSFQLMVNAGGTTLTANPGNDPVALFGDLSPGTSTYYSNAPSIESYLVGSVNGFKTLRVFADQSGNPLYLIGWTCGVDGPKGAWASPPIGATIGGWLGKDASDVVAWALPTDATYSTYSAYFVMAEPTAIGQTTVVKCMATASPPAPADGKTYASGAPAMPSPTVSATLTLLAK
jgi:hypothetical protein